MQKAETAKSAEKVFKCACALDRKNKTMLEEVFESHPDAMIVTTHEGRIAHLNRQVEALFGYPRGQLLGQAIEVLIPDRFRNAHTGHRQAYRIDSGVRPMGAHLDLHARRADGSEFPVDVMLSPIETREGTQILSVMRDVTDRRRTEEQLRRSEVEYRTLIEHAPYGIYRSTTAGRFVTVNPALVQMLGYASEAELLQVDLATDLYVNPEAPRRLVEQVQTAERLEAVEVEWRRKDGRVINVRLAGRARVGPEGDPYCFEMIAEDVTEMRRLQQQLYQSQKLEAIGTLAGGVAHDFNNLLTVIGGHSEFLLASLTPQEPARQDVLAIMHAAERGTAITQQLLAFSRRQVLQPRVSDLNAVITGVDGMLRRLIGEQIELVTCAGSDRARIKADPIQIEQVIMNLAVNARDAMPDGGRLTIQTAGAELRDTDPGRSFRVVPGPYVLLAVSDTGGGMDAETQARIFEPFFTTKERGKGTGLGLSTVYGIVKQSGGYIWVDSAPGRGTTFRIYLPKIADETEEGDTPEVGAAPHGSETVLLVEDDEPVRKSVRRALEARGFSVLEAARGEEAISIEQRHKGPIHVLLTDSVMPGLSGREVARRLALVRPQLKVVCMSGYSDDAALRHGVLQPNEAYLQKPFGPDAVARKVREVLDVPPLP